MQFLFTHAYNFDLINHKIHSANPNWSQLIMNLSYHPQFCKLQRTHLSQIGRLIPAQPNFHTIYKSEQCSPKHEFCSDLLVSYESWVHELSIHINLSSQNYIFFIWQPFQKCKVLFETPCRAHTITHKSSVKANCQMRQAPSITDHI